ncbi:hypothetical protein ACOMICROBIO_EPCKBFOG_03581 [Vibrio sp. B1FLJ16]|nr:hypothetical protein ACOMICROBIO_EPCKBFOG_03581 [Vibrio sp. B1FLJ16]CAE6938192.1 hypothetical protein ACOMICROBIO_EPCKBFOG_03581 [Vibrio sp. B1FLJ16]
MTQDYDYEEHLDGEEIEIEAIGIEVDAHRSNCINFSKLQTW